MVSTWIMKKSPHTFHCIRSISKMHPMKNCEIMKRNHLPNSLQQIISTLQISWTKEEYSPGSDGSYLCGGNTHVLELNLVLKMNGKWDKFPNCSQYKWNTFNGIHIGHQITVEDKLSNTDEILLRRRHREISTVLHSLRIRQSQKSSLWKLPRDVQMNMEKILDYKEPCSLESHRCGNFYRPPKEHELVPPYDLINQYVIPLINNLINRFLAYM